MSNYYTYNADLTRFLVNSILPNRLFWVLCFLGSISFNVNGQSYKRMMTDGNYSVQEVIDSANAFFAGRDTGKGSGYTPFKRWEYMATRLMNEQGYLPDHDYFLKQLESFQTMNLASREGSFSLGESWEDIGPTYWNATSSWNPGVGRITGFTVDPADPMHIIVGAQTGGVWKTSNGGQTWTPLCDYFSNMAVYATAIHPQFKNVYFFGSDGGRIYRSEDGGSTWQQMGSAGNSLINKIVIDPINTDIIYACSQWSGIYRSENAGQNWQRIANDDAGFDVVFHPVESDVLYASGNGFHKSTDGGKSFKSVLPRQALTILEPTTLAGNYLALDNSFSPGRVLLPPATNPIQTRLVAYEDEDGAGSTACVSPANAAAMEGNIVLVWRGGCTFAQKVLRAQAAGAVAVIVANNLPSNFSMGGGDAGIAIPAVSISRELGEQLFAALAAGEIIIAELNQPAEDLFSSGPKMIGVSAQDPDRVYLLEANGGMFGALYRSDDAGVSFSKLDHTGKNYFGYSTVADDDRGQAPRDMAIAVNPRDANEVHIAGILTWVSFDGGLEFRATSDWIPNRAKDKNIGYCHADVDIMDFVDSVLYVGTDGGLFRAVETTVINTAYFEDLTTGLGIRQFYKIGVAQTNPVRVSGGSQDNGTSVYNPQTGWLDWLGADGMETFIDKRNPFRLFGTSQNGSMYTSQNAGYSQSGITKPGSGQGNWVTPFEQDPQRVTTIYVGYEEVYRSDNFGSNWYAISQTFSRKLDHLKIAPTNSSVMYAAFTNELYVTTDGGATPWRRLTGSGFSGNITSIAIHPRDPNTIAISTNGSGKVFVSYNGGNTWSTLRLNLPDFSALCLVWQDNTENSLYLGMNYGIYYLDDNLEEWMPFNNGLPNVIVNELEINYAERKLYAGTYGRGLWVSPLADAVSRQTAEEVNLDCSIYPNPASDFAEVRWSQSLTKPMLRLFDQNGHLWKQIKDISGNNYSIDLRTLPKGMLYLELSSREGRGVYKISRP
jgi:photosystem II stability/assembly factor-like uncharacterized protein